MQQAGDGWELRSWWTLGKGKEKNCSYKKKAITAKGTEWQAQRKLQVKGNRTKENIPTKENFSKLKK